MGEQTKDADELRRIMELVSVVGGTMNSPANTDLSDSSISDSDNDGETVASKNDLNMNINKSNPKIFAKTEIDSETIEVNVRDWFAQFDAWFTDMIATYAQPIDHVNVVQLATATRDGVPSLRVLHLKEYTREGFTFCTNHNSLKAHQLDINPHAAMTVYWPLVERQVRITGRVERMSSEQSAKFWARESLESRFASITSTGQSKPVAVDEIKQMRIEGKFLSHTGFDGAVHPTCWSAYLLAPSRIEFMQRRVDRMHDRLVYEKIDSELMPNKHAIKADVDGWCYYHVAP